MNALRNRQVRDQYDEWDAEDQSRKTWSDNRKQGKKARREDKRSARNLPCEAE